MIKQSSWDNFLSQAGGEFLQSWSWGEFQKSLGKKVWRVRVGQKSILIQAQIIEERLPFGRHCLYLPRGPVFSRNLSLAEKKEGEKLLWQKIKNLEEERNAIFLRIEPLTSLGFLPSLGRISSKRTQPSQTLILDLRLPLEKIFQKLSIRSRYNIRLARRKGVKLIQSNQESEKYFSAFLRLIQATGARKKFRPHSSSYYQKLLKHSLREGWGRLFLAEYQGKIIGTYLSVFWQKQAIALHGAVDYRFRSTKVSHFLQWEQIKFAKDKGCLTYDFWGIDERRWPGVTFFKKSFGGEVKNYPQSWEIPFQHGWFSLYQTYRSIKRKWF